MSTYQKPVGVEELDEALDVSPATPGALDQLSTQFGSAPWWAISGAFHGLLILLVFLIGMVAMKFTKQDQVMSVILKKPEVIQTQPPPQPVVLPPTAPNFQNSKVTIEAPVLTEIEEPSEPYETPDEAETHSADGEPDLLADFPMGKMGFNKNLGTGDGGCGRFGPRGKGKLKRALDGGGGKHTEGAVELALQWLAGHQESDGHWDCVKYGGKQADVATTGLALLAFLGAGHTEKVGKHKTTVLKAVQWLHAVQNADGSYFKNGETHGIGYHHAIAGLAMAEAAGMAGVPATVASAQKGIDYTVEVHQKGDGSDKWAWRYAARSATNDISVTGWFIMQLKAAKVAGLNVDTQAFDGAIRFLDSVEQKAAAAEAGGSYAPDGNRYGYTDANGVSPRRTAIGCLGRLFMGTPGQELAGGVNWFVEKGGLPNWGANGGNVDLYYWYYGTFTVFQYDGPRGPVWTRWNKGMVPALCDNQRLDGDDKGSWDPVGDYSNYWGRAGQTALGALCLEVYYRYLKMGN